MTEDRLVSLIIKRLTGQLAPAEEVELEGWASENPGNRAFLSKNEGLLEKEIERWKNIDPAEGYQKWLGYRKARGKAKILRLTGWSAAACMVAAIVIAGVVGKMDHSGIRSEAKVAARDQVQPGRNTATLTLSNGQKILLDSAKNGALGMQGQTRLVKDDSGSISYVAGGKDLSGPMTYNVLTTPQAGQFQLLLPDGSRVWLNNLSSIRYPTAFVGKDRTVEVTGEAYFEIKRNTNMPFIVKVRDEEVEVLGTSFNVMSYPEEGGTRTTLVSGAVRVRTGTNEVKLKPDEQSEAMSGGELKILKDVASQDVISWKNGFFYFGGTASFDVVLRQLARWYDIDVVYQGTVPDLEFSGKIDRNLPLDEVLKYLDKNQVHFRIEGRQLIVLP